MFAELAEIERFEKRIDKVFADLEDDDEEESAPTLNLADFKDDFIGFCRHVKIVDKKGKLVPFELNHIQKIFEVNRTGRDIVLKPRQVGLTTLEIARDLWTFLCTEGARVKVVCQSHSKNEPLRLLSRILKLMIASLQEAGAGIEFQTEAEAEWTLANGNSLVISVAGASVSAAKKTGRGGTVTRLHLTEVSVYEHAAVTMTALLSCVPPRVLDGEETGSEIVSESTANGASGYFYRGCQLAEQGKGENRFHFYPWHDHLEYHVALDVDEVLEAEDEAERNLLDKGVTVEQLKWRRNQIVEHGLDTFNQEYPEDSESCFLTSGRGFFCKKATKRLIDAATQPFEIRDRDRIRVWKHPVPAAYYLISIDTSEGVGADASGALVYDIVTGEHVATLHGQYTPWELAKASVELGLIYNTAYLVVERNNHGHSVIQALEHEHKYPRIYRHQDKKLGWPTDQVTRPQMLDAIEEAHRQGLWKSPDKAVVEQFRTFIVNKAGKPEAASGDHDDLVLAAAIGWAVRQTPRPKRSYDLTTVSTGDR